MNPVPNPISILDRRKIEAQIARPLIKAFIEEIGEEKALAVVHSVIGKLARQSGMIVLNMAIGLSTPPAGTSLFIAVSIAKTDLQSASRYMMPFLIAVILVLVLVTYCPPVTLWFPDLIMK